MQNNKNEAIQTLIYGAAGKQKLLYNQSDIAYNLVKDAKQSVYGFTAGNQTASNLTKEVFAQDSDKENDNHHVALKQDYNAYGQAKRSMLEETPQFNGEMLSSGNLTYMRARNYDSTIGQFTSKDTWLGRQTNPLSQNRNTFVENNPVNFVDPSGHIVSGNGMYLCSDDGDRNCSIANSTQRIIYDSNAQVSYEDAQYRAVNRYANQPHIMNDWFQNNRPSSKYQKLQNLANYAQQAAIAAEQKAKAEIGSALQELESIDPALKQTFGDRYKNSNLTDHQRLMLLRQYIQICKENKVAEAKAKAKAEWDAKPWWEKVGSFVSENWVAIALTVVAVVAVAAAVVITGGVAGAAIGAAIGSLNTAGVTMSAAAGAVLATKGSLITTGLVLSVVGTTAAFESNNHTLNEELRNFNNNVVDIGGKTTFVAGILSGLSVAAKRNEEKENQTGNKALVKSDDIKFTDKFSNSGKENQVFKRGWNNEKIANTINNPYKVSNVNNSGEALVNDATGNSATRYYINDTHYVVIDNVTGKVIQIADLNNPNWKG